MQRIEIDNPLLREAAQLGEPVEIFDPMTGKAFFVISSDKFQSMIAAGDDFDPRDIYPFIEKTMADSDAHDPLLDLYQ